MEVSAWRKRLGLALPSAGASLAAAFYGGAPIPMLAEASATLVTAVSVAAIILGVLLYPLGAKKTRAPREKEQVIVFIEGKKVDLSAWMHKHPGGAKPIRMQAGRDATEVFYMYHSAEARAQMQKMIKSAPDATPEELAAIRSPRDAKLVADFAEFRKDLEKKGYFKASVVSEVWKIGFNTAMWLFGSYMLRMPNVAGYHIAALGEWNTFAGNAIGCALYTLAVQQYGWISHDYSHHSPMRSWWWCDRVAEVCGFAQCLELYWWKARHNTHHVCTNEAVNDPDIKTAPLFTYVREMYNKVTGHNPIVQKSMDERKAKRAAARAASSRTSSTSGRTETPRKLNSVQKWQPAYFLPTLGVLQAYWMLESFLFIAFRLPKMTRSMVVWLAAFATFIWTFQNAGLGWLYFYLWAKGLATGVVVFATHYAENRLPPTHTLSLVEQTAVTTRNIKGGVFGWMHYFSGGIGLQIEHHLFPTMPRHNLIKIQPLVKKFYADHGLDFHESSLSGCMLRNIQQLSPGTIEHVMTMS